jgi:hypothetical protein
MNGSLGDSGEFLAAWETPSLTGRMEKEFPARNAVAWMGRRLEKRVALRAE